MSKAMQLGGFPADLDLTFAEAALRAEVEASKQGESILAKNTIKYFVNKRINELKKNCTNTSKQ